MSFPFRKGGGSYKNKEKWNKLLYYNISIQDKITDGLPAI